MHNASVHFPNGAGPDHVAVAGETMARLISALRPIRRNSDNPVIGDAYELWYQAGMDPTNITVKIVDDDTLVFVWDDFTYVGGNPKMFKATLDSVLKTNPPSEQQNGG